MRRETFGPLDAVVTGGTDRQGGGDGPCVVLLHGFGAPGEDLVPLWRVLDVPPSVRFVFPAAPIDLGWQYAGGRAWWRIDLDRIQRAMLSGDVSSLIEDRPAGLDDARAALTAFLDEVERRLAPAKLVLGGFSQGAMLALDAALSSTRALAGLVLMSGTLLNASEWIPRMPSRKGLRVVQSHGTDDPLLPFSVAERLRDELTKAGLAVDFVRFRGGHEIPESVLERVGALVSDVARAGIS